VATCVICGDPIPLTGLVAGRSINLRGRKRCLSCQPYRPLRAPRKPIVRAARPKVCEACGRTFPRRAVIDGALRNLDSRRFCLVCSPFAQHNTSGSPPGPVSAAELAELRRKRRNAKTYRYQKRIRAGLRADLVASRGGRCEVCGYTGTTAALEFHHRDPRSKEFTLSRASAAGVRVWAEAAKCDLLCANCHRRRHLTPALERDDPVVRSRRATKERAVALLGGRCASCLAVVPPPLFEFHHLDARTKDFAISHDGITRRWSKIEAELAKCILLCANCHRETHAKLRARGVSEAESRYTYEGVRTHARRAA
jgi:5-methylcytosine-specific restriction endonuclease McrA